MIEKPIYLLRIYLKDLYIYISVISYDLKKLKELKKNYENSIVFLVKNENDFMYDTFTNLLNKNKNGFVDVSYFITDYFDMLDSIQLKTN